MVTRAFRAGGPIAAGDAVAVASPAEWMPGDIIACYGADRVSRVISYGTFSPFAPRGLRLGPSHVAIIAGEPGGEPLWVESTTKAAKPCLTHGKPVAGVQSHRIAERIAEYEAGGGHCRLFRFTPLDRLTYVEESLLWSLLCIHFFRLVLTTKETKQTATTDRHGREITNTAGEPLGVAHAQAQVVTSGVGYDYGGALISGTRVLKFSRFLAADLDRVFCSELIAALLMRLNRLCRANPTRFSPASLLRSLVRSGTYRDLGVVESKPTVLPFRS